ncbi:conserved hypothetical protein [Leishmania major strain Friedlin]|uniref:Uncharacterized protein n=1 Tax=Leishmania major TaxID=5664 RepID=Q4Q6S6_LEIMA|nr:conserved hypothetical protein [Leishmania major strain Friedlin]CAG9578604.1 hypothetical_protein_-_conserved [Leishmania major strain Friedlin]CAJ06885.1 conserved hypothetical protein [Leishmania major strain Friedlin]|eukprot:XP_001684972.1 conserved hypothetical protein [Leishmania major strain Friedlin]
MEGSKKYEEASLRGITRHHVWKSRTSDLTVINLRDPTELLGIQDPLAVATVAETKQATAASPPPPLRAPLARPVTGKQESLNVLLAKLQLCRPAQEPSSHLSAAAKPLPQSSANATPPAVPSAAAPSALHPTACVASPAAAASPAIGMREVSDPSFPDPKESSSGPSGQFEFITGTNIPGQGVVKKTEAVDESSSMALFHDPLWGGSLDAFALPTTLKPSPKPQLRASLSELYASAASNSTSAFASPPAPASQPQKVASPPVATVTASPMPTTMTSSTIPMMGGIVQPPTPPQLNTPFPMYTVPIQYMAQQPQFPTGMVYNAPNFFPYGATPMMMTQPQHIPQGYAIPAAAMMRPGTNVKAMPFVPGNTM